MHILSDQETGARRGEKVARPRVVMSDKPEWCVTVQMKRGREPVTLGDKFLLQHALNTYTEEFLDPGRL